MKNFIKLISVILVLCVSVGCSSDEKDEIKENAFNDIQPVSSIFMSAEDATKVSDKVPVHLYFAEKEGKYLANEIRYIPLEEAKKSVAVLSTNILEELIKGPAKGSTLKRTIPEGVKLVSPPKLEEDTLIVNFSKDFVEKHGGSKEAEELTIYSIVNSITEIKDVNKVKFLIEGKEEINFKGNFKFNIPFPRNPRLIGNPTNKKDSNNTLDAIKKNLEEEKNKSQDNSDNKGNKPLENDKKESSDIIEKNKAKKVNTDKILTTPNNQNTTPNNQNVTPNNQNTTLNSTDLKKEKEQESFNEEYLE